jgi:hypothetical protein
MEPVKVVCVILVGGREDEASIAVDVANVLDAGG